MSLETILIVIVLAFATVYGTRWLVAARARRNRRVAASLTNDEIDRLIRRRDADHFNFVAAKTSLIPRLVAVVAGIIITITIAFYLNRIAEEHDGGSMRVELVLGWILVALCAIMCIVTFVARILHPFILLIRIIDADQIITDEMRSAALARRAQTAQKPRRSWFRHAAR